MSRHMFRRNEDDPYLDALRRRLADAGLPLVESTATSNVAADVDGLTRLVVGLLESADTPRVATIPCVLAAHAEQASAIVTVVMAIRPEAATSLGFLYRLTRCLCTSRSPDMEALFGRRRCPTALEFEPDDPREPEVQFGEAGIADARDADPVLTDEAIESFDAWIEEHWSNLAGSRRSAAVARFRATLESVLNTPRDGA